MFGIGASELVLIVIVALIVVGPKRLPAALRAIGRSLGEFRKVTRELRREVGYDDVVDEVTKPLREGLSEVHEQMRAVQSDVRAGFSPKALLGDGLDDASAPGAGGYPAKGLQTPEQAAAIIAAKQAQLRAASGEGEGAPKPTSEGLLTYENEYPEGGADAYDALPEGAAVYPDAAPVYSVEEAREREANGPPREGLSASAAAAKG